MYNKWLTAVGFVLTFTQTCYSSKIDEPATEVFLVANYRDAGHILDEFSSTEDVEKYLKDHPSIEKLGLSQHGCYPEDFSLTFLNKFRHVTTLTINGGAVETAGFNLDKLDHITTLDIGLGNPVHRFSIVAPRFGKTDWEKLGTIRNLRCLRTTSFHLPYLAEMPHLERLTITTDSWERERSYDLSPITQFSSLIELSLNIKDAQSTSPLAQLTSLKKLTLYSLNCQSRDYAFLSSLHQLEKLDVQYPDEMPPQVLKSLSSLQEISLGSLKQEWVEDVLQAIGSLQNLRVLKLGSNIRDLSPLANCKNLQEFECSFSPIESLAPLAGLPLRFLGIRCCKVKDLTPISAMTQLEALDIYCNYPHLWAGLINHPSLKRIGATKDDLIDPRRFVSSEYWNNLRWDKDGNLHPNSKVFIENYDKMLAELNYMPPLEVLVTIPHLELVNTQPEEMPEVELQAFQKARPDVDVANYVSWRHVKLTK